MEIWLFNFDYAVVKITLSAAYTTKKRRCFNSCLASGRAVSNYTQVNNTWHSEDGENRTQNAFELQQPFLCRGRPFPCTAHLPRRDSHTPLQCLLQTLHAFLGAEEGSPFRNQGAAWASAPRPYVQRLYVCFKEAKLSTLGGGGGHWRQRIRFGRWNMRKD